MDIEKEVEGSDWTRIFLINRENEDITLFDSALLFLNDHQRQRLSRIENTKRRSEYTLSRLALRWLLDRLAGKKESRCIVEQSPKPPLACAMGKSDWYCSISHTRTWIGVAVSSLPCALDVEWMRPDRKINVLYPYVFGSECAQRFARSENFADSFYFRWGAKECAVKLDAEFGLDSDFLPRVTKQQKQWVLYQDTLSPKTKLVYACFAKCHARVEQNTWKNVLQYFSVAC